MAPNTIPQGSFGESVGISGDTAVVGGSEKVYVFTRSGGNRWDNVCTFKGEGVQIGGSVAIDGDTIAAYSYKTDVGTGVTFFRRRSDGSFVGRRHAGCRPGAAAS